MRSMSYQRFWLTLFGLVDFKINYTRISHRITDEEGKRIVPMSIVSGAIDYKNREVEIGHSRRIGEIDLLHELIELLNPDLPHDEIDPLCHQLIAARKRGTAKRVTRRHKLGLRSP